MNYRRDIDGLRAIAVIPVVLFHAFPDWVTGGYVGVDVFFVISGYLITGLLMNDIDAGSFSLLDFYERRARRILPALAVVLLFTLVACGLLLLPTDFWKFSGSLLATGAFASNLFFWRTTGYFEGDVEFKPLLHTWSLAVEEQFYIFFPPLLAALCYWLRRQLVVALFATFVLSLAICILLTERASGSAFYLLPARAWELMMGALLAVRCVPQTTRTNVNSVIVAVGLLLIGFSVVFYTPETSFPGFAALAPAVGTALIIYGGAAAGPHHLRWILESRALVGIGLISYSLYLWHWPMLATLRYYFIEAPPATMLALAVGLSVAMAGASWRWVENPVRRRRVLASRPAIFGAAAVFVVLTMGIGAAGLLTGGFPQRLSPEIAALSSNETSRSLRSADREYCLAVSRERLRANDLCVIGARSPGTRPAFVLWGDSHAETFRVPLNELAIESGTWGYFVGSSGCPPLAGLHRFDKEGGISCADLSRDIIEWLSRQNVQTVFLSARWALNMTGERYGEEKGARVQLSPGSTAENADVVAATLRDTVGRLAESGKRVVLISGIPEVGLNVPRTLALHRYLHKNTRLAPTLDEYMERNRSSLALLDSVARESPNVQVIHPYRTLCPAETGLCQVAIHGIPLYSDDDHLSVDGGRFVIDALRLAFSSRTS